MFEITTFNPWGREKIATDFKTAETALLWLGSHYGEIIHAETGTVQGVDAFNEIVSWRGGQVLEVASAASPTRTVEGNWQGLLMHAVHWADEQQG